MNFVNKLNFEKYFDSIFPKKQSNNSKLQEISLGLCVRMEEESMTKGGFTYVPNDYEVYINLKDYRKLKAAVPNDLNGYFANYLAKEAQAKGYIFAGVLSVSFLVDRTVTGPNVKIIAVFTSEKTGPFETTGTEECGEQEQTKVFEKFDITLPLPVKSLSAAAVITVVAGPDEGTSIELADIRINIGRRPSNEMVLNDKSTSRLHAYIVRENGGHVIYDARSLNGTYVNGENITKKKLADSDEIKIGDTVILYKAD